MIHKVVREHSDELPEIAKMMGMDSSDMKDEGDEEVSPDEMKAAKMKAMQAFMNAVKSDNCEAACEAYDLMSGMPVEAEVKVEGDEGEDTPPLAHLMREAMDAR